MANDYAGENVEGENVTSLMRRINALEAKVIETLNGAFQGSPTTLSGPWGMQVDSNGDVWVLDTGASKVRKFDYLGFEPVPTLLLKPGEFVPLRNIAFDLLPLMTGRR